MIEVLYGTDEGRIAQKKAQLKQKYKEAEVVQVDCAREDPASLFAAIDAGDLFGSRKLIFAENASFLSSKNTTRIDPADIVRRKNTDHVLVLVVHSEKLDRRKKAVKELEKAATLVPCKSLDAMSQQSYIREVLEREQLQVDRDTFSWLCTHVGLDPLRIDQELEKLKIFSDHPSLEDTKALVTVEPLDNVFVMTDALFEKNGLRLMAAYRNFRAQSMEALAVIMLLAGQVRFLFQVRVLMDDAMGADDIARTLQAHPYRIRKSMDNASRFTAEELMDWLEELAALEQNMKSGRQDMDAGFEMFCLKLMEENG